MFVDVEVAGKQMQALIDTSASNLYMSEAVSKNMDLRLEETSARLKMVSSEESPAYSVICEVSIKMVS